MLIHKPLWEEGILLAPQHFQQQSHYQQFVATALARLRHEFSWGVADIVVDEKFLLQGKLKLESLNVLFPDGVWLDSKIGCNPLPTRSLDDIPVYTQTTLVYLAVPNNQAQRNNLLEKGESTSFPKRFVREYRMVKNHFGEDNVELAVENLNLQLKFDFEDMSDDTVCPLLRLIRNEQGEFALDTDYIPPSLFISANEQLLNLLRRINELLISRQQNLSVRKRARHNNIADLSASDANLFWFLHSVNSVCPELLHLERSPARHPEDLYILLSRLLGMLNTFAIHDSLLDIETYNHLNLYQTFFSMEYKIRELLDIVIPSPVVQIDLEQMKSTQWKAKFNDHRIDEQADFYLAIQSKSMALDELKQRLPVLAKVGSTDVIERVINTAVLGIPLQYMSNIPPGLPFRMDQAYFRLDKQHNDFKQIMLERQCSIYIPAAIDIEQIHLYAMVNP